MLPFAWLKNGKANTREHVTSQVLVWFLLHKEVWLPTTSQSPQLLLEWLLLAWGNGMPTEHQPIAHDSNWPVVFPQQVTAPWRLLWQCCALEPWLGHCAAFGQDMVQLVRCVRVIASLACRRGWQGPSGTLDFRVILCGHFSFYFTNTVRYCRLGPSFGNTPQSDLRQPPSSILEAFRWLLGNAWKAVLNGASWRLGLIKKCNFNR